MNNSTKFSLIAFIVFSLSLLFMGGAFAADKEQVIAMTEAGKFDPGAPGAVRAQTCLGCHGVASYTNVYPSYRVPKLAGQYADYIVAALKAYRSGERKHRTMKAQAHTLSEKEMRDVANYFASLDAATPNPTMEISDAMLEKVGTCVACHANDGSSLSPEFPRIGGQHRDYLLYTLKRYKSGERKNAIMAGIVTALSEDDMRFLSKYFAAQDGLGTIADEGFLP